MTAPVRTLVVRCVPSEAGSIEAGAGEPAVAALGGPGASAVVV